MGESLILNWVEDQQAVFPSHNGRASVNVLTGALTLSAVTVADSGVYVVQSSDPQVKANASITVLGKTKQMADIQLRVTHLNSSSTGKSIASLKHCTRNQPINCPHVIQGECLVSGNKN